MQLTQVCSIILLRNYPLLPALSISIPFALFLFKKNCNIHFAGEVNGIHLASKLSIVFSENQELANLDAIVNSLQCVTVFSSLKMGT